MKNSLLCIVVLVSFFTSLNAQNWIAANRFSIQAGAQMNGHSTLILPDGGQLMAGNFQNTITFGSTTLNAPSPSLQSGYLVKLDASLQPVWAKVIPYLTYDLHMDTAGDILIAGSVSSKLTATDSLACLSKLDPSGNPLAYFQAAGSATSWAKVLRTDPQGNVYIAGERFSSGTAVFGTFSFPPTNSRECFLLKLNPALNQVNWATYTGNSANLDNIYDIELDTTNGFIYTAGNYSQNYSPPIIGCGCYNGDFFVEKLNTNTGASVWKKIFSGGSGDITKQFIRLSDDGQKLSAAGCFKKTIQFEATISLTANTNTDYHLYLAEMNTSNGVVQWAQKLSSTGDAYLWQVAKQDNDLWLYGYFRNQTTIGNVMLSPSSYDVFLARTLTDANVQEAEKLIGPGPDFGYGLDVRDDVVAVTGNTMSTTMTIGSFSLPGTTSSVFVARKGEIVVSPPVAGFTAGNTSGCGPLEVTFTNTSLQSPTSFHWEFPGGTPASSTDMSPTVVYQNSGQYTVTLIATNAGGSDTLTQQQVITIMPAPDAAFSTALSGLQLTLQNQSTNANTWLWNFGDGQTSTLQNPPPHVYANCGNYTVSLISTNLCGSDTMVQMVSLGTPPNALFTHQLSGLQLTLQNQSTGATAWLWNFGDGQTSTLQNPPPHVYANCGNYTVSLISTNLCGSDTMVQMVSLGTPPNALFTHQLSGLELTLQNQSTGATAWLWNFGDGQTSTLQNPPPHIYTNCGNYTVSLISTNLCGSDTMVQMVSLGTPPNALFTHQLSGLQLTLQNQSTNANTWLWNFGDGQTSTQQNPIHTYTNCGNYTVSLISTNQCGSDTMVQMVALGTPPNALFTHQLSGLELTLQNQSTGATAWLWNFGDGQISTLQNPIHIYTNCGNYTVSLISTNLCGSDTMVQEISVISFPAAIFDFQIDGLELTLQNQSSNGDSWLWNFGDGQTSTLQNPPPHVYADTGVYIVTLTVTNQCGVSIFQEEIVVSQMSSAVYSPAAASRVHIWPNPNNGVFTLEWQPEAGKQAQVRLYSASGVLLGEWRLTQPQETLTVDQLPAGIYPLQLKTGKGSVWKKVVIVVGK